MKKITEETLLPIGLVMALLGGVVWLTNINYQTMANAKSLDEIKLEKIEEKKMIIEIRESVIRIEEKLKN